MESLPYSRESVRLDQYDALRDVQQVCREQGIEVKISLRGEPNITRDSYTSIKKRASVTGLTVYAFPVEVSPTTYKMEKAGINEKTDCIVWTATQDWIDAGLFYEDIEVPRTTVEMNGCRYQVKQKNEVSQLGTGYLYITLGLTRL